MSVRRSASFFLIVCILVCAGSAQKIITAELEEDVILPCKVPNNNINILALEWSRPDQDPEYVLLYRNGRLDPENQHESYQNRVDLQDKEMKNGDVSLILKNVKMEDTGKYVCRVFEEGKIDPISIITLDVLPSGDQDKSIGDGGDTDEGEKDGGNMVGIIVGSVVGVILLLVVLASVGFLIYKRSTRQNQHVKVPLDERPVA